MVVIIPLRTFAIFLPPLYFLSLFPLFFCFHRNGEKISNVHVYVPLWKKRAVCMLCACLINLSRLEWMCFCLHEHECMRAPQFHLKAVLFLSVGLEYVLWSRMADKWMAIDWGPASRPAASQLCERSWWITIHWGKSILPFPANVSCLACLQSQSLF